jgi:hypothetical protein
MRFFNCILLVLLAPLLHAQLSTAGFDSISIAKPRRGKASYEFAASAITPIDLKWKAPKRSPYTAGQAAGDATRKLFTRLLGGSVSNSESLQWLLKGEVNTGDENLSWKLDIYCNGELEKTSSRVRNSNGTKEVVTDSWATIFWEQGATIIIKEKGDTAGNFQLSLIPNRYDSQDEKLNVIFSETTNRGRRSNATEPAAINYKIGGQIHQSPVQIFYNGDAHKAWIFRNDSLQAVCQLDDEDEQAPMLGVKPDRQPLYMLVKKTASGEYNNLVRLAFTSRLLQRLVSRRSWERG